MFNTDQPGKGRGKLMQPTEQGTMPNLSLMLERDLVLGSPARSTLSAEAKEWFPPNYVAPTPHNFYPRQGNIGYHAPRPVGYQPRRDNYNRSYGQNRYQTPAYTSPESTYSFLAQNSIPHLTSVMVEVTRNPGKFSLLSGPLVDSFASALDNLQHTQPLVNAIVNHAVNEPNFSYNGARLCTMFDSVEPRIEAPSLFRICLLERCAIEGANIVNGIESSIEKVCGFALFLAELYMQLENLEGGRITALGDSLCVILKHLLGTSNEESVKSVCQILKLSGLALDADCKLRMDDIFCGLHVAEQAGVQSFLVRNVINLRHSRWGSGGFADMVDIEVTQTPPPVSDSMFYLPEGHTLTQEETAFLSQHLPSANDYFSHVAQENNDCYQFDPEMNAEQREDYIEFLKMSNQMTP